MYGVSETVQEMVTRQWVEAGYKHRVTVTPHGVVDVYVSQCGKVHEPSVGSDHTVKVPSVKNADNKNWKRLND